MDQFHWTASDTEYLKKHYPDMRAADIAQALGSSVYTVYQKAYRYGIKKSDTFLNSEKSGRLSKDIGLSTRFKKGNRPWNKGVTRT